MIFGSLSVLQEKILFQTTVSKIVYEKLIFDFERKCASIAGRCESINWRDFIVSA